MANAMDQEANAVAAQIAQLDGRWTGDTHNAFRAWGSKVQQALQENAKEAWAVRDNLNNTAATIDKVKQGIRDIVGGIAVTILASFAADILSGGLALVASGAEGAAGVAAAGRIAAVLEELAVVLREFQAGTKALQASKWFINLQRQWRIGGTANVLIKLGTHAFLGPRGLVDNLKFTWGPNEGGYLLLGNVLWAGGAQALYGLKGIGIVRELQFVKGAGIVGNFGKNALPFLSQISAGGVIALGGSTLYGLGTRNSLHDSTKFAVKNLEIGAGAFAVPALVGGLRGAVLGPAYGMGLQNLYNFKQNVTDPNFRKGRGDVPLGNFLPTNYGGLMGGLPMAPAAGVVPSYTVKPGDNLWNIAAQQYPNHDPHRYPDIYWGTNGNSPHKIVNPNLIYPGEQVQILPERISGSHASAPLPVDVQHPSNGTYIHVSGGKVQAPLPVPPVNGYQPVSGASLPPAPPPATHHLAPGGSGSAPHPQPAGSGIVTVRPGDTLSAIAQRNHLSLQQLEGANRGLGNPNHIYPGEQVVVPEQPAA